MAQKSVKGTAALICGSVAYDTILVFPDRFKAHILPDKLHTLFVKLREYNHGPSLVLQIVGVYGASANLIGEPTCVMFRRQLAINAGGLRTDIHQTVDLDFWLRLMLRSAVCFVPHELSVRYHTANTETAHIKGAQRHWLDQLRILTWMIVDPASTIAIRTIATPWWLARWLTLLFTVTAFGPQRWSRLKTLLAAPIREFIEARRFRDELIQRMKPQQPTELGEALGRKSSGGSV